MRAFAGCTSLESVTVYAGEVDILKDVWIKNPNYSRGEEPIPLECTIIGVKGSIKTNSYEDKETGENKFRMSIQADKVTFLSSKAKEEPESER